MKKISFSIFIIIILWVACTRDSYVPVGFDCGERITYDSHMKEIIDLNCSYSGCHDGVSAPGDYTSYEGISVDFDGNIFNRVVTLQLDTVFGMPPWNGTGPKDLSDEHFMLMNCWISEEFPEN